MSAKLENLPRSAQILKDFANYCETKVGCPHLSTNDKGETQCRHEGDGGECKFESCPIVTKAIN